MKVIGTYKERVHIKPITRAEKTASGIILPATVKDKMITAEVIHVSKHLEKEEEIHVGDIVLVPEVAGVILDDNSIIINSYDIFAFLDKE